MSTKVKERLKQLMLELTREERLELDKGLENYTKKSCDEAIEMLSDDKVRLLVDRIKKKKRKLLEVTA